MDVGIHKEGSLIFIIQKEFKMKGVPIAILEQFIDKGITITYMSSFLGKSDGPCLPYTYAIFKVYGKKKMTFMQKLFDFGRHKKMLTMKMISSQIHKQII